MKKKTDRSTTYRNMLQEQPLHSMFDAPISREIWSRKYRYKDESSISDSFKRVVSHVYKYDTYENAQLAYDLMCDGIWMPAGRIHAGAGTEKRVTLINCYVSPTIEDSMRTLKHDNNSKGIMDALTVAAYTQQMGGGIGMNFDLRPCGALVNQTGSVSSGNIPFMKMYDAMCSTIMSSGERRGAMMATMFCDHPDVEAFIEAKHQPGVLTNFNVSVLVTDAFIKAVSNDDWWYLHYPVIPAGTRNAPLTKEGESNRHGETSYVYKKLKARELWNKILRSTYEYAEPGVIFIDRVNERNNLNYCEYISATNPCGEQPLPPNSDCNLGAINLARLVLNPFTDEACVDWFTLRKAVKVGVRFLDNVLDVTLYPTPEQELEAMNKRRIGLGITGLGNMLQQLRCIYGSHEAVSITREVMETIRDVAYEASANLAEQRGPFPMYDENRFLQAHTVKQLPEELRSLILKTGIRNGVLLTIAPTGTTSLYYGNVSSGCEPTFAFSVDRKIRNADGSFSVQDKLLDYGYNLYRSIMGEDAPLPDYMEKATALVLSVEAHVQMQAICQKFVDASISKTVNCPAEMTFEEFNKVYELAYVSGCKGCTTYRPSDVRGSILSVSDEKAKTEQKVDVDVPEPRPASLQGITYKRKWPGINHAFYITINDKQLSDGRLVPFEMFIATKSVQHQEWIAALTRTVSAVMRKGGDFSFLVDELKQVHSHRGNFLKGKWVPSLVAYIGSVLEEHFILRGVISSAEEEDGSGAVPDAPDLQIPLSAEVCPSCEAPTLTKKEGCKTCLSCGYSDCG